MVAREEFRRSGVAGDALFTSAMLRAEAKALRSIHLGYAMPRAPPKSGSGEPSGAAATGRAVPRTGFRSAAGVEGGGACLKISKIGKF